MGETVARLSYEHVTRETRTVEVKTMADLLEVVMQLTRDRDYIFDVEHEGRRHRVRMGYVGEFTGLTA